MEGARDLDGVPAPLMQCQNPAKSGRTLMCKKINPCLIKQLPSRLSVTHSWVILTVNIIELL